MRHLQLSFRELTTGDWSLVICTLSSLPGNDYGLRITCPLELPCRVSLGLPLETLLAQPLPFLCKFEDSHPTYEEITAQNYLP